MIRSNSHSVSAQILSNQFKSCLRVRFHGGPRNGQIVRIGTDHCTIGSGPEATLRLICRDIAPLHCDVQLQEGRAVVRRLDGAAYLNGAEFESAELSVGDILSLGPIDFEVMPEVGTMFEFDQVRAHEDASALNDLESQLAEVREREAGLSTQWEADRAELQNQLSDALAKVTTLTTQTEELAATEAEAFRTLTDLRTRVEELELERESDQAALATLKQQLECKESELQSAMQQAQAATEPTAYAEPEPADQAEPESMNFGEQAEEAVAEPASHAEPYAETYVEPESPADPYAWEPEASPAEAFAEPEIEPHAEPEAEAYVEPEAYTEPEAEAYTEPEPTAEAHAEPEMESYAEPEIDAYTEPEPEAEVYAEPEAAADSDDFADGQPLTSSRESALEMLERLRSEASGTEFDPQSSEMTEPAEAAEPIEPEMVMEPEPEMVMEPETVMEPEMEPEPETVMETETETEEETETVLSDEVDVELGMESEMAEESEEDVVDDSVEAATDSSLPMTEEELEFSAPVDEAPIDTASILAKFGHSMDMSDEDDEPMTPVTPPVSIPTPEPETAFSESEDDSIQDYMNQLMQRVGTPAETPAQPKPEPSKAVEKAIEKRVPETVEAPPAQEVGPLNPSEFVPRAVAPEASSSLQALRAVANTSARSAIDVHQRRNYDQYSMVCWFISIVAGVVCFAMAFLSETLFSLPTLIAAVCFGIAGVAAVKALAFSAKAQQGRKKTDEQLAAIQQAQQSQSQQTS